MKLSFRTRTSYSITQVGDPCTLNSEDFVKAVPPYKGETEEDFWNYINDNLSDWEAEEYIEDNEGILSEELLNSLYFSFVDYPTDIMFDSRTKSDAVMMDGGELDKEYTKWNGFNVKYSNDL